MANPTENAYTQTIQKFLTLYRHLRRYSRRRQKEGISGRKLSVLRYLETSSRTVGQIRDYLYISDSGASELIARLEKMGYVTRRRSKTDNRVVIVKLTAAGQDMVRETPLGGIALLRQQLQTLPPERLAMINDAISELLALLEIDDDHS